MTTPESWPELTLPRPTVPEMEALRVALRNHDNLGGEHFADRVAEAARAVLDLYDDQLTKYDLATSQALSVARAKTVVALKTMVEIPMPCCCPTEIPSDTVCSPCRAGRHHECVG